MIEKLQGIENTKMKIECLKINMEIAVGIGIKQKEIINTGDIFVYVVMLMHCYFEKNKHFWNKSSAVDIDHTREISDRLQLSVDCKLLCFGRIALHGTCI